MPESQSFGVGGKMRQTSARRMRCPNKSASGNRLGQNDPHPPATDDKDPDGVYEDLPSFLALWKDADPDIPILKEAKTEYAKLQ
jgi:hypothetical protein